mgnify:CR=1 FL=1
MTGDLSKEASLASRRPVLYPLSEARWREILLETRRRDATRAQARKQATLLYLIKGVSESNISGPHDVLRACWEPRRRPAGDLPKEISLDPRRPVLYPVPEAFRKEIMLGMWRGVGRGT